MSELRIYFSGQWHDSASPCSWALCDDKGALLQSGEAPLAKLPQGHDCIAIIAAEQVLHVAATLPAGARRRWQAALPYVAEEFTLADPEDNHVVPGSALADGRRMLAIVDKAWLRRIVDAAQQARLSLRQMYAESLLPAVSAGNWCVVWDGSGGFVKTSAANGTVLDAGDVGTMPLALRLCLDNAPQLPQNIEFRFQHNVATEQRMLPQWSDLQQPLRAVADWDWRRAVIADDALNLLWGEFAPRAKIQEWWPKLRPALYLLLVIVLLEILGSNLQWALLSKEKFNINKEMSVVFRTTFGDSVTLMNAPLQMQRNLAELRHAAGMADSGDFLPLLDAASRSLVALPAGSVVSMHYEAGRLDVDIRLSNKNEFMKLKSSLQRSGVGVRMSEVRDLGNIAEAKLTLQSEGQP